MPVPVRGQKSVKGASVSQGLMTCAKALENYGESYGVKSCNRVVIGQIDSLKARIEVL